jgi:uncharacterized lipoprotein YajG
VRLLALIAALLFAAAAAAQLRAVPIPPQAQLARMTHVEQNVVEVNGARQILSAGAQIRDQSNRIIVPTALPQGAVVRYLLDGEGKVHRVWVLTPEEAAANR